jgi:hypothetical protein
MRIRSSRAPKRSAAGHRPWWGEFLIVSRTLRRRQTKPIGNQSGMPKMPQVNPTPEYGLELLREFPMRTQRTRTLWCVSVRATFSHPHLNSNLSEPCSPQRGTLGRCPVRALSFAVAQQGTTRGATMLSSWHPTGQKPRQRNPPGAGRGPAGSWGGRCRGPRLRRPAGRTPRPPAPGRPSRPARSRG